jgi:hypothetical protein
MTGGRIRHRADGGDLPDVTTPDLLPAQEPISGDVSSQIPQASTPYVPGTEAATQLSGRRGQFDPVDMLTQLSGAPAGGAGLAASALTAVARKQAMTKAPKLYSVFATDGRYDVNALVRADTPAEAKSLMKTKLTSNEDVPLRIHSTTPIEKFEPDMFQGLEKEISKLRKGPKGKFLVYDEGT